MIWVAFTLGFFGSLHCMAMCGPLAMGFSQYGDDSLLKSYRQAILYNTGRVLTYMILGVIFGLLGQAINIVGYQKHFSILAGVLLIILFLFSLDLERFLFKFKWYSHLYNRLFSRISSIYKGDTRGSAFFFGALNGLLPCGLVYLALAGSLTTGHVWTGAGFMMFFGLGTWPMMLGIMLGSGLISNKWRINLKSVFPVLHLALGVLLVYRGIVVEVPHQLDFWSAVKFPVICH